MATTRMIIVFLSRIRPARSQPQRHIFAWPSQAEGCTRSCVRRPIVAATFQATELLVDIATGRFQGLPEARPQA